MATQDANEASKQTEDWRTLSPKEIEERERQVLNDLCYEAMFSSADEFYRPYLSGRNSYGYWY
jgi:hypothetical protein